MPIFVLLPDCVDVNLWIVVFFGHSVGFVKQRKAEE
jgi:hypothetical protein